MKRQLIALGLLATSLVPIVTGILPAYALQTITIFEREGRAKPIGIAQHNSHYILRGAFGGRSNDSLDRFVFDVRKSGRHTFVFNASNTSQKINNAQLSLTTFTGRGIAAIGPNQPLVMFLPRGRYFINLSGTSSLAPGQFLKHQTHLLTPR